MKDEPRVRFDQVLMQLIKAPVPQDAAREEVA
jgi:hypothetical protein